MKSISLECEFQSYVKRSSILEMEMKIGKLATLTVKNRKAAVAEVKID